MIWFALTGALAFILPVTASAHAFAEPYMLPVPLWLYLYACAATLVISFALIGYFVAVPTVGTPSRVADGKSSSPAIHDIGPRTLAVLRLLAAGTLTLTIIAGLVGTQDPPNNISMTLFWVVFILVFSYATALLGNVFELISPWRMIITWVERCGLDLSRARFRYPETMGYTPSFLFYVGLIWLELFGHPEPRMLSVILIAYGFIIVAAAWAFGKETWLQHGELFDVYFRIIATMAPIGYCRAPNGRSWGFYFRAFFAEATHSRPAGVSLLLVVLFMLSSTTYDGMHETNVWVNLFWKRLAPLLQPLWDVDPATAKAHLRRCFALYQQLGLLLSPFVYLAVYWLVLGWAKAATKTTPSVRTLALEFAYCLIPIVFAYNVTHYVSMVADELFALYALVSDPFGYGWNLFGTGPVPPPPNMNMALLWHVQVAVLLAGHVASVYLAHLVALRVFATRRQAILSQVPMLFLMIVYTSIGLWVLSLSLSINGGT